MARNLGGRDQRELLVKFKVVKSLGKGSFGSVFQVQRLGDGQTYALKELDVRSMSQAEREDSVNEVRLLASVQHPNVIGYHEAFLDGNRLCIIMEYAPDGDLSKVIKKWQMMKRPMPEDLIWKLFIQVVRGLAALHNMKILHRDIKPGNIMVMSGDIAKIGDLGIAKLLTTTAAAKTQIGTPHYMPPEIWKNRPYSFSSDVWALGCLLYEMATFSVPFEARSLQELRYKVFKGTYPPLPGAYSKDLSALVKECLDQIPERRPTVDRILSMPAVTSRIHLLAQHMEAPPTAASVLNTIKVPRGNFQAIKGKLPPANYATDMKDIINRGGFGSNNDGAESNAEVMEVHKLPPELPPVLQPQPGRPVIMGGRPAAAPQYPPQQQQQRPAPPALPPGLPQAPRPAYGMRVPAPLQPSAPPSAAPYGGKAVNWQPLPPAVQIAATPGAQSQMSKWSQAGRPPGVGVKPQAVSESHAAYGAFYHSPKTPVGAAPGNNRIYADIKAYAAANNKPWNQPAYPPPGNPYLAQANNRPVGPPPVNGGARLPAIPQNRLPAQQPPPRQVTPPNARPPPWNYGVGVGARAAAMAYANQLKQAQAAQPAAGAAGQARYGAYPPPQWQAAPARRY